MKTALILVDIQNDYFPGGSGENEGALAATANARIILDAFRAKGLPVFHVWHENVRESANGSAPFFKKGTRGIEIHEMVAPTAGEPTIRKLTPNSFVGTDLGKRLEAAGIEKVVIAGMMSYMCVNSTTRAAKELGYDCSVASDACATIALEFGGVKVPAAMVHAASMAGLNGLFAKVAPTAEILRDL